MQSPLPNHDSASAIRTAKKQQAATPALAAATAVANDKGTALDFCGRSADRGRNVRAQQQNCSRDTRADNRQDQRVFGRSGARFIPQIRSNELAHDRNPTSCLDRQYGTLRKPICQELQNAALGKILSQP